VNTVSAPDGDQHKWLFVSDFSVTLLGNDQVSGQIKQTQDDIGGSLVILSNSNWPTAGVRQPIEEIPELMVPDFNICALGTEI
jgi:hypothetical protein